jgi:signal transduction histidine kinase
MSTTDTDRQIAALTATLEQANNTLRDRMEELSLARSVGDAISNHTSIWSLSSDLVDAIATTVNCRYALIYAGSSATSFELQAVSTVFSGPERFPIGLRESAIAEHLEKCSSPLQVADFTQTESWIATWPFPKNLPSWLFVPLLTRNHIRGILCLADDKPAVFDDRTLRPLMIVVPQISSAFSNIALYDRLRESETKHKNLVSRMQDVVFICNRNWEIIEANPASDALFSGPIVGKSLTELFASPNAASEFVQAASRSRVVQNFETHLLTPANQRLVALVSCCIDGERYSGIIKDVTERTRLMDQIARAQKMESIGTLASGVAHDFNNILGVILPNADLINNLAAPESALARYSANIVDASKHAAQLTKQLLSLSRSEPSALRRIDLNETVRSTGKLLAEMLHGDIRLEFALAGEPVHIKADETQIQQVLLNLAINARDAMPEGGLIKFASECEGTNAIVRVQDTGHGIDPLILPKIFDPFFTTKTKSQGTGLGLSVAYRIVKQTGGAIDVKSELGVGTEFILTFPSVNETRQRMARRAAKVASRSKKILIVDDEPELLDALVDALQTSLSALGYSIVCASNGLEAVQQIDGDVRLIILDMIMPEMDGVATLRSIRQKMPDVKVVVTSGYTSREKTPLLESLRIERFVQKPFELVKLVSTVRDVLDGVTV